MQAAMVASSPVLTLTRLDRWPADGELPVHMKKPAHDRNRAAGHAGDCACAHAPAPSALEVRVPSPPAA